MGAHAVPCPRAVETPRAALFRWAFRVLRWQGNVGAFVAPCDGHSDVTHSKEATCSLGTVAYLGRWPLPDAPTAHRDRALRDVPQGCTHVLLFDDP